MRQRLTLIPLFLFLSLLTCRGQDQLYFRTPLSLLVPAQEKQVLLVSIPAPSYVLISANEQAGDIQLTLGKVAEAPLLQSYEPPLVEDLLYGTIRVPGEYELTVHNQSEYPAALTLNLEILEPIAGDPFSRIDQLMAPFNRENVPGVAVTVIKDGRILHNRGYGQAVLENGIPFTPETVTDIGSVAKQFTCYAIVQLEREGRLRFDDDIREYLPYVPDLGSPITIRHLIHHTSGLREIYDAKAIAGYPGEGIRQEEAEALVRHLQELNFPPGEEYLYCNTAYMLLANIVEAVSEMDFEPYMQTRVFGPLGMEQAFIMDEQGEWFPRMAGSYSYGERTPFVEVYDNSSAYGQGGIYTDSEGLIQWFQHLRGGIREQDPVITQMLERGILNNGDTLDYAFGLQINTFRGARRIGHSGSSAGFRTQLLYFPDADIGLITRANSPYFPGEVLNEIQETLLPADLLQPPTTRTRPAPAEAPQPPSYSTEALQAFSGRYYSQELDTYFTISVINNKLFAYHRVNGQRELTPYAADQFRAGGNEWRFIRGKRNRITGMRLSTGRIKRLWFEKSVPQNPD